MGTHKKLGEVILSGETPKHSDIKIEVVVGKPPSPELLLYVEANNGIIYNFIRHPEGVNDTPTGEAFLKGYLLGAGLWKSNNMCLTFVPEGMDMDSTVKQVMKVREEALLGPPGHGLFKLPSLKGFGIK